MAGVRYMTPDDLTPFADIDQSKAQAMIEDAEAMAALAAPCITDEDFQARDDLTGALRAVLRRAILRWNDAGTGAVQQVGAGPFQQTTAQGQNAPKNLYWPSEIEQLRDLCAKFNGVEEDQAFTVSMVPDVPPSLASNPALWFQMVQPTPHGAA